MTKKELEAQNKVLKEALIWIRELYSDYEIGKVFTVADNALRECGELR